MNQTKAKVPAMGADRITVSLDEWLSSQIKIAAAEDGLSVSEWVSRAAAARLGQPSIDEALEALEAEFGPVTEEQLAESRRRLGLS